MTPKMHAQWCCFFVLYLLALGPVAQAKGGNDQDQLILLNDSAAALEDSDPVLSKDLTKLADEKEKEWEEKSAEKNPVVIPITDKDIPGLQAQVKLLNAAAIAIKPEYPLIAKSLEKMAQDIQKSTEIAK